MSNILCAQMFSPATTPVLLHMHQQCPVFSNILFSPAPTISSLLQPQCLSTCMRNVLCAPTFYSSLFQQVNSSTYTDPNASPYISNILCAPTCYSSLLQPVHLSTCMSDLCAPHSWMCRSPGTRSEKNKMLKHTAHSPCLCGNTAVIEWEDKMLKLIRHCLCL